jgi:glycosyltransferase involved in cell wall biosynthesis
MNLRICSQSGTTAVSNSMREVSRKRLRIALVDMHLDRFRGGMSTALSSLVEALSEHCDVTVFCSRSEGGYPPAVRIVRLPAIPVYRFLIEFTTFRLSWGVYRRWKHLDRRYDLIHCGSPLYGGGQIATVNFCSAEYLRQLRAHWRPFAGGIRGFPTLGYRIAMHRVAAWLEEHAYGSLARNGVKLLLPVSGGLSRSLEEHFEPSVPMRVIANAVDLSRFTPGPDPEFRHAILALANWSGNAFLLLFVGAGEWDRKGLDLAIGALASLPNDVKLVVVGSGDRKRFERLAERYGVTQRIHFTGMRRDVSRFYRATEAFVFPSRYEAQPLVCLEAMACGLPVVATRFHGIEDYLLEGVNGFLVSPGTEAIATAILKLLEDPGCRLRMGRDAAQTAQRFRKEEIVRQILETYREFCAQNREEKVRV